MNNQIKAPFSKTDWMIYRILLAIHTLAFLILAAWNLLLLKINLYNTKFSWIDSASLEARYGPSYVLIFLGISILIMILSILTLLNYRYELISPTNGYAYKLKNANIVIKQTLLSRKAYGISAISLLSLVLLVIIQQIGLFINPPFHVSDRVLWIVFFIYILVGIIHHILSLKLSKLDSQRDFD